MTAERFFSLILFVLGGVGMYLGLTWMFVFLLVGVLVFIHDWRLGRRVYRMDDRYYIVTDAKLNSEED